MFVAGLVTPALKAIPMQPRSQALASLSKVPAVTFGFWVVKVAATTLGETGGDWVSMSLKLGYLIGSVIFAVIFLGLVAAQVRSKQFHAALYWPTIIATTTLGTTMADFADRSLGIGYPGGVGIVTTLLIVSLAVWYRSEGTVAVASITEPKVEWFYWVTILFSQTLGTALGDCVAGSDGGGLGLGYETARSSSVPPCSLRQLCTSGQAYRARCSFGQRSSLPVPLARRLVTSWTNPLPKEVCM
jgi:uncharacterized membrane-anchored protein